MCECYYLIREACGHCEMNPVTTKYCSYYRDNYQLARQGMNIGNEIIRANIRMCLRVGQPQKAHAPGLCRVCLCDRAVDKVREKEMEEKAAEDDRVDEKTVAEETILEKTAEEMS